MHNSFTLEIIVYSVNVYYYNQLWVRTRKQLHIGNSKALF